jgi:hypothetical protein
MPSPLSDVEWVMIVLAAIYLFECACWVRREVVCFGSVWGSFRALPSPSFMGNDRNKLVIGNPSPLARCFLSEPWPIAVSPQGICSYGSPAGRHIAFAEMCDAIVAVEKQIHVNRDPIGVCASEQQAQRLAEMLKEVAAAQETDRGKIIGEHLDRWTDDAAAGERFAELKKMSVLLRTSGITLFVLAFVCGPAMYYAPWRLRWPVIVVYLAAVFVTWMLTVWDYSVCRKKLFGETFPARFRHVGMLLVSPASAMRSPENLLRHGLAAYHPLAVAAALSTKERFASLARRMILALEHPTPAEIPADPAAGCVDAWFRTKLLKRLNALLCRMEIDPAAMLRAAEPLDGSLSYCPRCHNQFVVAEGTCSDCGGLALVAYAVPAMRRPEMTS